MAKKNPYYRVDFTNCDGIEYDYTIVDDLKDIQMYLTQVEDDLRNPEAEAEVTIRMVMMTDRSEINKKYRLKKVKKQSKSGAYYTEYSIPI